MDQNLFEQKYMEKSWKIKKNPYQKYIIEESVKKWAQFLKEKKIKGKLLDVGCGNGKNSVYFAQKGFKVLGVDCGCLHHLRKKYWNQYKKNILRLIKEKGYFYLHGFSVNSKKIDNVSKKRNWVVRKGHYTHFFSIKEVQDLFGKDFKIIETYEFKNLNNKFIVRTFYMQRI
jgi:cyclopropane fatty-acyl-phospholipid synthase-like methyltransferase